MKQSLQLKLGTQLTMTPQLQQAIRLLQLSTLDLQQEVQSALDSNPLLEVDGEEPAQAENTGEQSTDPTGTEQGNVEAGEADSGDWSQNIPDELPVDTRWEDIYSSGSYSGGDGEEVALEQRNAASDSLHDHLLWQLNLTSLSVQDKLIGENLIDGIAPNGFLETPPADIAAALEVEEDEVLAVLKTIQQFDPTGCGARDLRECMLLQLRQLPPDTPWLEQALTVVEQHLDLLGKRDFRTLSRRTRLNEQQLGEVMRLIQTLTPNPGEAFGGEDPQYVIPDIIVRRKEQRWLVELNPETTPRLRINSNYASLIRRADNSSDNNFLRDHLQEARWFLKSLQSRNETLLKVATSIVEKQQGFFEHGPEAMKPMVLADIAETIGMHESTISRVTTQKYMLTPRGVFELKYFFSSHVSTDSGEEASSTAIRALIRKLIDAEQPRKPLSDNKISQELGKQGIKVARRTVAKYREAMGIPSSSERKRLV
ncbi:RNA polymerase factor sigma-54 [Microbulbifer thermotolerans]|uniref:RNA polymerase sigma-54 factor n=1 Tax=Microbulbifer thermotolerans TaxID=252514 RepID=A0A143HJZ7_MICTH|nr:RNA polymerase factor sigma-54 [Microbulbifer thermotolerans]AMX02028.1 RNA polymerase sigma-54 factor [Microbulbifer thermotolerans]MCX2780789.1 RNA polymerase factor sigma-54 [Microbulbifer thermotolerans]MCX2783105.1 RNA polymerase factor sigma-54 [Microbulbifer thermotolerans]MCX2794293.1 RNA polymerase factor sigma-54 [Microbulbifer thermotolerans]MCX2800685.1 RNA polymerase factor sigma-54 [Microbulbifer thermotolerans]